MGYFDGIMAQETGHESLEDRRKAFKHLLDKVIDEMDTNPDARNRISVRAAGFVSDSAERFSADDVSEIKITTKQYFYMKDIYDRIMEVE